MTIVGPANTPTAATRAGSRPGRFLALVGVLFLVCVVAFGWSLWAGWSRSNSTEAQSRLLGALEQVVATVTIVQSSQRGYVLSGSEDFLDPYREAKAGFDGDLDAFRDAAAVTGSDPERTLSVVDLAKREVAFCEASSSFVPTRRATTVVDKRT